MTNLVAHKVFGHYSMGIWNRNIYRDEGHDHKVSQIKNLEELREVFNRLEMQNAQVDLALDVLKQSGVHLF